MENNVKKSWKRFLLPTFIGLLAIAGIVYGIQSYLYSRSHEETDNAQLEGNISPIIPKVSGYIEDLRIEDNQFVKKGDTLFIIDNRDFLNRVHVAEAAYSNALANVNVVSSGISNAVANEKISASNTETSGAAIKNAEVKLWKAEQDFARYKNLLSENSTTQQQYDAAKAEKESAEAQLSVLKKQLATAERQTEASGTQIVSTQKQMDVAHALAEQRKADLEYARLQLAYTIVTAPVDGVISKKSVQSGQYVNAGQMLFSIVADDNLWVVANFKETQLGRMKIGLPVEVTVDAFENQPLKAVITSFSKATGAKFSLLPPDNATGNFVKVVQRVPVKIEFTEKSGLAKQLSAGMSVKVAVTLDDSHGERGLIKTDKKSNLSAVAWFHQ